MIQQTGCKQYPESIIDPKNGQQRAEAYLHESYRHRIFGEIIESGLAKHGDSIMITHPHTGQSMNRATAERAKTNAYSHAAELYEQAKTLHKEAYDKSSTFQKMKPWMHNAVVVTVVAAEVISIPILLANIYMMTGSKHHHPHHLVYAT